MKNKKYFIIISILCILVLIFAIFFVFQKNDSEVLNKEQDKVEYIEDNKEKVEENNETTGEENIEEQSKEDAEWADRHVDPEIDGNIYVKFTDYSSLFNITYLEDFLYPFYVFKNTKEDGKNVLNYEEYETLSICPGVSVNTKYFIDSEKDPKTIALEYAKQKEEEYKKRTYDYQTWDMDCGTDYSYWLDGFIEEDNRFQTAIYTEQMDEHTILFHEIELDYSKGNKEDIDALKPEIEKFFRLYDLYE